MYPSIQPYIQPALSFGLYGLKKAHSAAAISSTLVINHFFLNFISDTKSDHIDTTFYLIIRNIIPLAYGSLLAMHENSNEKQGLSMMVKHTAIPALLGIICGKYFTTMSKEHPLTWQHVIGMEILRKLQG